MHATSQPAQAEQPGPGLRLLEQPGTTTLAPLIFRFLNLLRKAVWRAFQHDAFAIAKASAYSSILTFFPTLLVLGSALASRSSCDVAAKRCQLAVLVPPATMQHVEQIAGNLEKMPPKSTYFYPKLLSGLVFNSLKGN